MEKLINRSFTDSPGSEGSDRNVESPKSMGQPKKKSIFDTPPNSQGSSSKVSPFSRGPYQSPIMSRKAYFESQSKKYLASPAQGSSSSQDGDGWTLDPRDMEQDIGQKYRESHELIPDDHVDEFDVMERYEGTIPGGRSELFLFVSREEICSGTYEEMSKSMFSITADGGVKKQIIKEGNQGQLVPNKGCIWIHYATFVEGLEDPIDSTENRRRLASYKLNDGQLLFGVEIAVKSMLVGEISKYIIQPKYAYGRLGCPPLIPKECPIMIAIELVKVAEETETEKAICDMDAKEREQLGFSKLVEQAERLRHAGNKKFAMQEYYDAVDRYDKAVRIMVESIPIQPEEQQLQMEHLSKLFSNLALCYLRVDDPEKAYLSCEDALQPGMPLPDNPKINYRFAQAAFLLNKVDVAAQQCLKALKFDPGNPDIIALQNKIGILRKRQAQDAQDLYRDMSSMLL